VRSYLVLDIETVPDLELYAHPEVAQGVERPFPPLHSHRPIVIGVLWLDENYLPKRLGCIGEDKDERGMLQDFSKFCEQHRPNLVTFNGRGFDLPVLSLRCMRQGVPMNFFHADRDYRYRFSDMGHIDLYDFLSDHGAARVGPLDSLARLIGLPGKVGVDGSQVEGLYNAGQLQAIRNYCLADVTQTAFLLLRYRLLQGLLDVETYRARAQGFIDYFTADGRLAPVLDKIDRRYLMLE
jgi:predicted PolB exonuclease-like 3'-5' exonuclease